ATICRYDDLDRCRVRLRHDALRQVQRRLGRTGARRTNAVRATRHTREAECAALIGDGLLHAAHAPRGAIGGATAPVGLGDDLRVTKRLAGFVDDAACDRAADIEYELDLLLALGREIGGNDRRRTAVVPRD